MSYKRKITWILTAFSVVVIIILVFGLPHVFGLCKKSDIKCIDNYSDYLYKFNHLFPAPTIDVVQIVFFFSIPIILISIALLFLKERVIKTWLKFSIIFLPIVIALIIVMARGTYGTFISIDEKSASVFFAVIFLITSLLIITIKSLKLRREGR